MHLLIMTRGRVGKQRTLSWIPSKWKQKTFLVVPPSEQFQHGHQTISVPSSVTNYSQKFQFIIDGRAIDTNKLVILDDDLVFAKRVGDKLVKVTDPEDLTPMFHQIEELLDYTALVGVHPRQMGHQAPLPYAENGKIICIQGVNRNLIEAQYGSIPRVDQFPILADVMLNCSLLSKGIGNKLVTTFVQDHGPCQAPGGCSLYRTPEMQKEAVEYIANRFAPFAKAVTKRPKSAKWMGDERTDLHVQWKRMYKAGVEADNKFFTKEWRDQMIQDQGLQDD